MKTTLHYLSLNAQTTWHRQVEQQLKHLNSLTTITTADVVIEHQREAKPAVRFSQLIIEQEQTKVTHLYETQQKP